MHAGSLVRAPSGQSLRLHVQVTAGPEGWVPFSAWHSILRGHTRSSCHRKTVRQARNAGHRPGASESEPDGTTSRQRVVEAMSETEETVRREGIM